MSKLFLSFLTALLLSAALPGRSQELTLMGVPAATTVVPVEGQGYFILYRSEAGDDGRDIYAMRLLDNALKVRYEYALALPVGVGEPQVLPGKASFGLVFRVGGGVVIHTFNTTTGAHQSTELAFAPDRQRQSTGSSLVVSTPAEGFCLVQSYGARDTLGFRISVLDAALQPRWAHLYFPTAPHQQQVEQVVVSKDAIGVVLSDAYRIKIKTPQEHGVTDKYLAGFDAATGKELFRKPLYPAGSPALVPRQLAALADGRLAMAGQYQASRTAGADSSLGVFVNTYRPDGTATQSLTPWADLGTALRNGTLLQEVKEGRGRFSTHELFSPDGTALRLVAEYASGSLVGQFVIMGYDAAGQRTSLYPIERSLRTPDPSSRYLGIAGRQSNASMLLYSGQEPAASYVYATPLAEMPGRTAIRGEVVLQKLADNAPPPPKEMPQIKAVKGLQAFADRMNGIDANMNAKKQGADQSAVYHYDGPLAFATAGPGQTVVYRYEPTHKQLRAFVQELR